MSVSRVEGLASGPQGSEQVSEQRKRFVRLVATAVDSGGDVTYTKGDVVALCIAATALGGVDAIVTFGPLQAIKKAAAITELACVGVAAETITVKEGKSEFISVQVEGFVKSANVATATTIGLQIFPSGTAGQGALLTGSDPDTNKPYALALANASGNLCDLLLLNPLDY
tara:strand:- start:10321 stop:10830 length:510 start_codon:yes stop_codon:yes gene_type:complete